MRAASIIFIIGSLACACSTASQPAPEPKPVEETAALEVQSAATPIPATPAASPSVYEPPPMPDDARSAWIGDWPTTFRITHSTCPKWPVAQGTGTTTVIRHNETTFQVRRVNGWSAYGLAGNSDEMTLQMDWKEGDTPIALTLKLRFESAKRFVMTTEIVVAPWSEQPEGCEAYAEEIGLRQ